MTTIEEKGLVFAAALAFWFALWALVSSLSLKEWGLSRYEQNDLRNRAVSFVHGLMGLLLSAYQEFFLEREYGGPNSDYENYLLAISLAYFFYDTVAMAYYAQDGIGKSAPLPYLTDAGIFIHHAKRSYPLALNHARK